MAYEAFDGELDEETGEAAAFVAFDGELDAPAPVAARTPRRGGTRAEVQPFTALDDAQQAERQTRLKADAEAERKRRQMAQTTVLDRPSTPPPNDPMLNPDFVTQLREDFGALPPEQRRSTLREMAKGSDVYGRAARSILTDVEREEASARAATQGQEPIVQMLAKAPRGPAAAAPQPPRTGAGIERPTAIPNVDPSFGDLMDSTAPAAVTDKSLRTEQARGVLAAANNSVEGFADRKSRGERDFEAEAFAEDNPLLGALASGGARQVAGLVNAVPMAMDFAARLVNKDISRAPNAPGVDGLLRSADSYLPKEARQDMGEAWDKGEFGSYLLLNLTAQAPQLAMNFIAAVAPPLRPALLPAMGATTAGESFARGDSSLGAALKGLAEVGGERVTLGVFDRASAALSRLPAGLRQSTLQSVGRGFLTTGVVLTTESLVGALEETTTQILQNGVDRFIEGKGTGLMDGVAEAAVLGAAMNATVSAGPRIKSAIDNASGERQFARALEADTNERYFLNSGIEGFANAALDPNSILNDGRTVNPSQTVRPPVAPVRAEEMPTTVIDPQTLVVTPPAAVANAAAPLASPPSATQAPQSGLSGTAVGGASDGVVGVATIPQGQIAQTAEALLQRNAQDLTAPGAAPTVAGDEPLAVDTGARSLGGANPADPGGAEAAATAGLRDGGAMGVGAAAGGVGRAEGADAGGSAALAAEAGVAGNPAATAGAPAPDLTALKARYTQERARLFNEARRFEKQAAEYEATGLNVLALGARQAASNKRLAATQLPNPQTPEDGPALRSFNVLADAFERLTGTRPVPYSDISAKASDGFYDATEGRTFVNLESPELHVARTVWHEFDHHIDQLAAQGNAPAQQAQQLRNTLWDMITPEGKRAYAEQYLFRGQTLEQVMASPANSELLRKEMLADFMGRRGTDRRFMQKLAARDPQRFGGFARQWINLLKGMIAELKGNLAAMTRVAKAANQPPPADIKNVDQYLKDLTKALSVAEEVALLWAQTNPQLARQSGYSAQQGGWEGAPATEADTAVLDPAPVSTGTDSDAAVSVAAPTVNPVLSRRTQPDDQPDAKDGEARLNELGSFDLNTDLTSDYESLDQQSANEAAAQIPAMSAAEMSAIEAELAEEQANAGITLQPAPAAAAPTVVANYTATPDKALKPFGIMAEQGFPSIVYAPAFGNRERGRVEVNGQAYEVLYDPLLDRPRVNVPENVVQRVLGGDPRPGQMLANITLSVPAAKAWSQRFIGSAELFRRGFDLYTAIPGPARKRVAEAWKRIAQLPKAFEFATQPMGRGRTYAEVVQSLADQMLAGSPFSARAEAKGGSRSTYLYMTKDGQPQGRAEIEYENRSSADGGPLLTMHTIGFSKGSGAGKPFYQIAFAFSDAIDAKTTADPNGLLAINTYRRTEQQFSAALRGGKTRNVQPGYGQRIYGWNAKTKGAEQEDRNMVRLALAAARNAAEFFPGIRELQYDIARNQFRRADGSSAETDVSIALLDADTRAVSLSRSTLARAAITFEAIRGTLDLDGVREVASPVLYSRRNPQVDEALGVVEGDNADATDTTTDTTDADNRYAEAGDSLGPDYKRLQGRRLSYLVRVADTGEVATLTADAQQTLQELDDRADTMRRLLDCLKR